MFNFSLQSRQTFFRLKREFRHFWDKLTPRCLILCRMIKNVFAFSQTLN